MILRHTMRFAALLLLCAAPSFAQTETPLSTKTPTPTRTPTRTATNTRTATVTSTPTATGTNTRTPTITRTPTVTDTPTVTATPTVTLTPTPTPIDVTDILTILVSDGTAEFSYTYTGNLPFLWIRNIGSNSVTIKLSSGITETTPATPTQTKGEYILPAGEVLTLPRGRNKFWFRTASGATTSLSVIASDYPQSVPAPQ